jgi:hypothetical protein
LIAVWESGAMKLKLGRKRRRRWGRRRIRIYNLCPWSSETESVKTLLRVEQLFPELPNIIPKN